VLRDPAGAAAKVTGPGGQAGVRELVDNAEEVGCGSGGVVATDMDPGAEEESLGIVGEAGAAGVKAGVQRGKGIVRAVELEQRHGAGDLKGQLVAVGGGRVCGEGAESGQSSSRVASRVGVAGLQQPKLAAMAWARGPGGQLSSELCGAGGCVLGDGCEDALGPFHGVGQERGPVEGIGPEGDGAVVAAGVVEEPGPDELAVKGSSELALAICACGA